MKKKRQAGKKIYKNNVRVKYENLNKKNANKRAVSKNIEGKNNKNNVVKKVTNHLESAKPNFELSKNDKINEEKEIKKVLTIINKNKKQKINLLKYYLKKANINVEPERLKKKLFNFTIILSFLINLWLIVETLQNNLTIKGLLLFTALLWTLGFLFLLMLTWLGFYFYIDMLMYNRKIKIESVLVDFLQLTSANIRAGMPIDQALWFAIRPRFGIFAEEIQMVIKKTLTGEPLEQALKEFSDKYDSQLLKNAISLLIEGMKAGGEIGDLLNNIADNIKDSEIMKKEMSANVMTYVIFISFATLLAAPLLMGLSYQLLIVINNIGSQLSATSMPSGVTSMTLGFGKQSIKPSDFKLFAVIVMALTSGISAMIITAIQKGNLKAGVKTIPVYIIISIILFLLSTNILSSLFSSLL